MPSVASIPSVDWELAKTLFCQGLSYPEIAQRTGATQVAIRSRASRNKWRELVATARAAVQQVQQKRIDAIIKPLNERADAWIDITATNVERTAEVLASKPIPTSLKGLRQHEEVWGMHVKRGRATFGLDSSQTNIQVNIGGLKRSLKPVEQVEEVIDVPSDCPNPGQSIP